MTLNENIELCHALIDCPTRRWNFSIPFFLILFIHLFFTFQMTMKGSKLALLLLLVVALEILLFTGSDAWFKRRRRRRCSASRPKSPKWVNNWHQQFNVRCPTSKKSCYQFCYLTYILCFFCAYFHLLVQHAHRMNNYWMIWFLSKLKFRFHLSCNQTKILWTYTRTNLKCRLLYWIRNRLMLDYRNIKIVFARQSSEKIKTRSSS